MLSRGVVSAVGHLQLPQLVLALSWSLVSLCILPYSELLCPHEAPIGMDTGLGSTYTRQQSHLQGKTSGGGEEVGEAGASLAATEPGGLYREMGCP